MDREQMQEVINDMRNIVKPYLANQLKKINFEGCGNTDKAEFETDFEIVLTLAEQALDLNRWIPISERLPKAGEYVGDVAKYYLVQNEYGDMLVARYTHSGYWEQMYQLKPISDEIVAWMPLPEPYKAESEE